MKKYFVILTILLMGGCAPLNIFKTTKTKHYPTMTKVYTGYHETGIASWYGSDFHGRPTASGEIYNMYAMTAAHKTLPLGTYVNVKNLENGREAVVKINDRGPFVKGRIIDLSYKAAKKLGMANKGTAKVRITVVKSPFNYNGKNFYFKQYYAVQIASFKIYSNAMEFKKVLKKYFSKTYVKKVNVDGDTFYRVLIGNYLNKYDAERILNKCNKLGYDGFIVEIDK